jgi:hypothetical protein
VPSPEAPVADHGMVVICARIWVNFSESKRASGLISTPKIVVDALVESDTK